MNTLIRDLRLAIRSLTKTPSYTGIVILCLALGISASTGIYSVVNAVIFQAVPFDNADEIIAISGQNRSADSDPATRWSLSAESFDVMQRSLRTVDSIGAQQAANSFIMTGQDQSKQLFGSRVTDGFFATYGHEFILGRALGDEEIRNDEPVVVISSNLWEREFNADSNIIGKLIRLDGVDHSIVGVIPSYQEFPINDEVYVPYSIPKNLPTNQHAGQLFFVSVKPKPGVTLQQVQSDLEAAAQRYHESYSDGFIKNSYYIAEPIFEVATAFVQQSMKMVVAAVAFLLAITILNVVNLLLVRLQGRQRQLAVMTAMGASTSMLFRQLFSEVLVLAIPGAALGILAAHYSLPLLFSLNPLLAPDPSRISVDFGVLVFSLSLTIAVALLVALLAAWRVTRIDTFDAIREGGSKGSGGPRLQRALSGLVVAEISAAVLLVVGAGLMVRTYQQLIEIDTGFEPRNLLTFNIGIPPSSAETHESRTQFTNELVRELRTLPGVTEVGAANALPIGGGGRAMRHSIQGKPTEDPSKYHVNINRLVTFGYFEAMDVDIIEGRAFTEQDRIGSDLSVIVSKFWADTHFPGESVIGKRVKRGTYDSPWPWRTIVGVAEDVSDQFGPAGTSVRNAIGPSMYMPNDQYENARTFQMVFTVRSVNDPRSLINLAREKVLSKDRDTLFNNVFTMEQVLQNSLGQERFVLFLFAIFAGIGLILAAAGIYGVIAYAVSQKVREYGIRIAVGARPSNVMVMVLGRGLRLGLMGLAVGIGLALLASSGFSSLLYAVSATDPLIYASVAIFLLLVTLAATGIPAWRATRIDPAIALREE